MLLYNNIKFQQLSFLQKYYDDPKDGIPTKSGIYYWVYYPRFDSATITVPALRTLLEDFTTKSLRYKEDIKGRYKYAVEVIEQGFSENGALLGLSPSKTKDLIGFLNTSRINIDLFHKFFIEVCFSRPFYVGKANNLRDRLAKKHFKRVSSDVLNEIDNQKINYTNIWIGYKEIPLLSSGEHINVIFEEILSRTVKPGLTKKPN